jgi:hypothetical protein
MDEWSPIGCSAIQAASVRAARQAEIFEEGSHRRKVGRSEAHMRDVLNPDHAHPAAPSIRRDRFLLTIWSL